MKHSILVALAAISITACVPVDVPTPTSKVGVWEQVCQNEDTSSYRGTITISDSDHYVETATHYSSHDCLNEVSTLPVFEDNIASDVAAEHIPFTNVREITFDSGSVINIVTRQHYNPDSSPSNKVMSFFTQEWQEVCEFVIDDVTEEEVEVCEDQLVWVRDATGRYIAQ